MTARGLLLAALVIVLLSACGGPAPTLSTSPPAPTAAGKPAENPLELVWKSAGAPDPFSTPDGLGLDQQGDLFVADGGNSRIVKLDSAGNLLTLWGSHGSKAGQFDCVPCGLAVDGQGDVYVTDTNNFRVQKFDRSGKFLAQWGSLGSGDGQFLGPFGLAVDRQGNVFVGDVGLSRVQKFDSSGRFLARLGSRGDADGQFSADLADIAVDAVGSIYVTDRSNGLQKFDGDMHFVAKWDACGDDRPISSATGVALDTSGNIYVYDLSHRRICKYDTDGTFLRASGGFTGPGGVIAVDGPGDIYVAEPFDNLVLKFRQP